MKITGSLLLAILLVGCSTTQRPLVPVPKSLEASSTLMRVDRKRTPFSKTPMRFGEWQVTDFAHDRLPSSRSSELGTPDVRYEKSRGTAKYHFVMTANDRDVYECQCGHTRKERGVALGSQDNKLTVDLEQREWLDCDLRRISDGATWTLRIDGSLLIGGKGYSGTLTDGTRTLYLRASHEIERLGNLPGPPLGYLFERDGAQIGSTELITPGIVRIGDEAGSDRDLIATASAALLLQPTVYSR